MSATLDMNTVRQTLENTGTTGRDACATALRGIADAQGIIAAAVQGLQNLMITVTRELGRETLEQAGTENITVYCIPFEVKKATKALFWTVADGAGLSETLTKSRWDAAVKAMDGVKFLDSMAPDAVRKREKAELLAKANKEAKTGADAVAEAAKVKAKNPESATVKALKTTLAKAVKDARWHDVAALALKLADIAADATMLQADGVKFLESMPVAE